jgi:hypothetical protein
MDEKSDREELQRRLGQAKRMAAVPSDHAADISRKERLSVEPCRKFSIRTADIADSNPAQVPARCISPPRASLCVWAATAFFGSVLRVPIGRRRIHEPPCPSVALDPDQFLDDISIVSSLPSASIL